MSSHNFFKASSFAFLIAYNNFIFAVFASFASRILFHWNSLRWWFASLLKAEIAGVRQCTDFLCVPNFVVRALQQSWISATKLAHCSASLNVGALFTFPDNRAFLSLLRSTRGGFGVVLLLGSFSVMISNSI